jgi:hypothetical protein
MGVRTWAATASEPPPDAPMSPRPIMKNSRHNVSTRRAAARCDASRSRIEAGGAPTEAKWVLGILALAIATAPARAARATDAGPDAGAKTLIDYFLPTPIVCPLTSATWGAPGVIPRDICNGLEDSTGKLWTYWDGKILEGADGTFHIFASRWAASQGFNDWPNALVVHGVSNGTLMGSYIPDAASPFTVDNGKGQNVTGAPLNDGSFVILDSPGNIFLSTSLGGPWTSQGVIAITANGYSTYDTTENQSLWQNADGSFFMMTRPFEMMVSATQLMGPYVIQGPSVLPTIAGLTGQAEDPVIWCSGGQYHMVANWWSIRKAWHLTSVDGIHDWKSMGLAYDPTTDFVRYTDGTVNHWYNMERPGVFLQNGHVTAFSFAVTDVEKTTIVANDNHLSKIIVVPFDGVTFDLENPGPGSAACPLDSGGSVDAGSAGAPVPVDAAGVPDAGGAVAADASGAVDAAGTVDGASFVDAAAPADAGLVDVEVQSEAQDAGGAVAIGADTEDASSTETAAHAHGCSCRTAGSRGANGATRIALLVGGVLALRQRRRRSTAAR